MGRKWGLISGVVVVCLLFSGPACGGASSPPPTATPAPTAVPLPSVPRPALDTPAPQTTASPSATVVHIVQPGESLGRIAQRYYNDANQWQRIYDANRAAIPDPNALTVGARLTIPPR